MSRIIKRAIRGNIVIVIALAVIYFSNISMNRGHLREALLILFMGELAYWLTIAFGLSIIKRKNKV